MKKTLVLTVLLVVVASNVGRIRLVAKADETVTPKAKSRPQTALPPESIDQRPRGKASIVARAESNRRPLPTYVIEPPDVLLIDTLSLAPKAAAAAAPLQSHDVVQVSAQATIVDKQTGNPKIGPPVMTSLGIDDDGNVDLGGLLGKAKVEGSTPVEAAEIIARRLSALVPEPKVFVTLQKLGSVRHVEGEHLVGPDGTINLGTYGTVYVAGMTIKEAQTAVEKQLSEFVEEPKIAIDVYAYNSKVYYIITEGAGSGDGLLRVPITGNETVLDALAQMNGVSGLSSKHIWIARPAPSGVGIDQILEVSWNEITKRGATANNYQVLPGDRIFVSGDEVLPIDDEPQDETYGYDEEPVRKPQRVKSPKTRPAPRASAPGPDRRRSTY